MKRSVGKILRWVLSLAMVALLIIFATRVNWTMTWESIRDAERGTLIIAAVANLISLGLKGVRWWVFLRPVGVKSLGLATRATFAGAGLNNVLVANGGEAARIVFVSRTTHVQSSSVLAALTMERLFEFIGYFIMLIAAAYLPNVPYEIARWRVIGIIALVLLLGLMVYLVRAGEGGRLLATRRAKADGWTARTREYLKHFFHSMAGLATPPRLVSALLLTLASWSLQIVCYHETARAAHLPIPLVGSICALLAANIGFLMRVTPGSVGVFQLIYALTASTFPGVDKDAAVAVAVLLQTLQVVPVTLLGIGLAPEFVFRRRKAPRDGEPEIERHI